MRQELNNEINGDVNIFTYVLELWKPILAFTSAGILVAMAFLTQMLPQYEASVLIEMAKVPSDDIRTAPSIEAPAMLIERLRVPTTYTPEAIKECGFHRVPNPSEAIAAEVKASVPRSLNTVVHITVRRPIADTAKRCVESLFSIIRQQQDEMVREKKDELTQNIAQLRARLEESQNIESNLKSDGWSQLMYLFRRDEINLLNRRIDEMHRALSRNAQTRLVSPPYASETKVSPRHGRIIAIGAGAGLMLGFLFGATSRMYREMRAKNRTSPSGP